MNLRLLLLAGAALLPSLASAQTFNRIVVFGDSLSDNGDPYLGTAGAQTRAG